MMLRTLVTHRPTKPRSAPCLALLLGCAVSAHAVDKSGVSPAAVSLPSGPGSIEGLGAEFQPDLNTGTVRYGIAVDLPAGTAGHTPALSLAYDGGAGNSPAGIGWSLSTPAVRRRCDKGIPRYIDPGDANGSDDDFDGLTDEPDEEDRFLDPSGEELVLTPRGYYFPENNSDFIRYTFDGSAWTARLPDGSLHSYGLTPAARVESAGRVFSWLLERVTDTNGNVIDYSYVGFPGSDSQKYLREIRYGPGAPPWDVFYFAFCEYGDRPDAFDDCRAGFLVRTAKRLVSVTVALAGEIPPGHAAADYNRDGLRDALIRRYDLAYAAHPHWSLLSSVTLVGADGATSLPPTRFGYAAVEPPDSVSAAAAVILAENPPTKVMDSPFVDLVDLNADGLPDLLETFLEGGRHRVFMNEGPRENGGSTFIRWRSAADMESAGGDLRPFELDLSEQEVHLADMDGDGLADLVFTPLLDGGPLYHRNLGAFSWGPREPMGTGADLPPAPFGAANGNVRAMDADFDKRIDVVRSVAGRYQVWYNLGKDAAGEPRWSDRTVAPGAVYGDTVIPFGDEFGAPVPGVQLADLNGDRLLDVAWIRPNRVILCPGFGYGRFGPAVEIPIDVVLSDEHIRRAALRDVTGDGLDDLLVERAAYRELWYWINLGNRAFSPLRRVTDLPPNLGVTVDTRWADINGNGTDDLVYACSEPACERLQIVDVGLLVNGSPHPNLLTRIDNGLGMTTLVAYQPSTAFAVRDMAADPWIYPMPNPVNVAARITVLDGLGHDSVTELRYHNGFYDGEEREFRGFERVEQIDFGDESQPTLVTEFTYHLGRAEEALKGAVLRAVARTEDGKVFSEDENVWAVRRLFQVDPPPLDPLEPSAVHFPYLARSIRTLREEPAGATVPVVLEREYAYDDYGNRVMAADYGRVEGTDRNYGSDERIVWSVACATPESPIWNLPVEQVTTDNGAPPRVAAHSRLYYDGPDFAGAALGAAHRGNLMRRRDWVGPSDPSPPPQPPPEPPARFLAVARAADNTLAFTVSDATGDPVADHRDRWIDTVRHSFDPCGNIIAVADPLCRIADGEPDPAAGHFRELAYDPPLAACPVAERVFTGPLVLEATAEYDLAFGVILAFQDFNGNQTRCGYDPLARLVRIIRPGGDPPETPDHPTIAYSYVTGASVPLAEATGTVNWVEVRRHERYGDPDAYHVTRTFVDGLGRALMTKEEDEDPARVAVLDARTFNARRQPFRSLMPFSSPAGFDFEAITAPDWSGTFVIEGATRSLPLADAPALRSCYDAAGRPVNTLQPDGAFARTDHLPLAKRHYDEEDARPASLHFQTPTVHLYDGLERLVAVDEHTRLRDDGTRGDTVVAWRTAYSYDVLDNLVAITDSQGNRKTTRFDALGRMTCLADPDRGSLWFARDDASNLVESVDAKGQRIAYAYDGANRVIAEDYDDPLGRTPDVAYHYDLPAGPVDAGDGTLARAANTRGYLAWVSDLVGEEHTSYDERGRVDWIIRRIPDPIHGTLVSFRTEQSHDPMDRVDTLTYPDGDRITHRYNRRGLLDGILGGAAANLDGNPSIVDDVGYVPSGQVWYRAYGNRVRTEKNYDRRLRMTRQKTGPVDAPDRPFAWYGYEFDAASNITAIRDLRPTEVRRAGDPLRNTQRFAYDDLYRLTRVRYSFAAPGEPDSDDGWIAYRCDRIGNTLQQTSDILRFQDALPLLNHGLMTYGGASGSWGRAGRRPADPPGPHALTAAASGRRFEYDANGNMTSIDAALCAWDFKDRLVALETGSLRAEYAYDYADRRTVKKVWKRRADGALEPLPSRTVLYLNRYFEVRANDQPVKYLYDGETRLARITGTIEPSAPRIQRFRLSPGWNPLTLAVAAPDAASRLGIGTDPNIEAALCWHPSSRTFVPLAPGADIPSGSMLWIRARDAAALEIAGDYVDPAPLPLPPGGAFLAPASLECLDIRAALPAGSDAAWFFEPQRQSWRRLFAGHLAALADPAESLPPGRPLFVHSAVPVEMELSPPAKRILYYHQDHLGSSAAVTDAKGTLVEENTFYPFGEVRGSFLADTAARRPSGDYLFAQKERDSESALSYFEARYLHPACGRFISVDPLAVHLESRTLLSPQLLNTYSYARNNPLAFADPGGRNPYKKMTDKWGEFGKAIAPYLGKDYAWKDKSKGGNFVNAKGEIEGKGLNCVTFVDAALAAFIKGSMDKQMRFDDGALKKKFASDIFDRYGGTKVKTDVAVAKVTEGLDKGKVYGLDAREKKVGKHAILLAYLEDDDPKKAGWYTIEARGVPAGKKWSWSSGTGVYALSALTSRYSKKKWTLNVYELKALGLPEPDPAGAPVPDAPAAAQTSAQPSEAPQTWWNRVVSKVKWW